MYGVLPHRLLGARVLKVCGILAFSWQSKSRDQAEYMCVCHKGVKDLAH